MLHAPWSQDHCTLMHTSLMKYPYSSLSLQERNLPKEQKAARLRPLQQLLQGKFPVYADHLPAKSIAINVLEVLPHAMPGNAAEAFVT